jgi:hypothetical protein
MPNNAKDFSFTRKSSLIKANLINQRHKQGLDKSSTASVTVSPSTNP